MRCLKIGPAVSGPTVLPSPVLTRALSTDECTLALPGSEPVGSERVLQAKCIQSQCSEGFRMSGVFGALSRREIWN